MVTTARDTEPDLAALAQQARWQVIKTVTNSKAGHIGGPLSMMDLLVSLYFGELRIRPEEPDWPDRDRFILSKGHAAIGLYSVLALRGFLELDELPTFDKGDSRLQGHPDVTRLPGLDASTGSLGQGLSVGGRDGAGCPTRREGLPHLGAARGRRDPGGHGLGGGPGRGPLQADQPDRDRRPQRAAAVRAAVDQRDHQHRPRRPSGPLVRRRPVRSVPGLRLAGHRARRPRLRARSTAPTGSPGPATPMAGRPC